MCVLLSLSVGRYVTFHNETFDLAFYARIAWGLARGDLLEPVVGSHVAGLHLSWVLIPLGWLGAIVGTVPVLLVAQAAAVGLAAWPMARIAARRFGDGAAWMGALVWLLHPNLSHVVAYEFHPGTLAVLPLAWALDAVDRRDARALWLSTLGVLICREDLALMTAMIGALGLGARRRGEAPFFRASAWVVCGSLAYIALFALVIHPAFAPPTGSMQAHFGKWGDTVGEAAVAMMRDPGGVIAHLSLPRRLLYLPKMLAIFALLPVFAPRWLLVALPIFAINLLSDFPTTTGVDSHYATPALVALAVAAIDGAAWLKERVGWLGGARTLGVVVCGVCLAEILAGATPASLACPRASFAEDARARAARQIVAAIGEDVSVQAPDAFLPHLAERRTFHRAPPPERATRFVVLDSWQRGRYEHQEELLRTDEEPITRMWLAMTDHALVEAAGTFLLFERGKTPREGIGMRAVTEGAREAADAQRLTACLSIEGARIESEALIVTLFAHGPCDSDLALRIGTDYRPRRVDLIAGGLLSPSHLRAGDRVESRHALRGVERGAFVEDGLRIGVLRSSGARPVPSDPMTVAVSVRSSR